MKKILEKIKEPLECLLVLFLPVIIFTILGLLGIEI
jgi:hypothetical protein